MCNWAYQWYRSEDGLEPRAIGEEFWGMLLDGIRARGNRQSAADAMVTGPTSAGTADPQTAIQARRPRAGRAAKGTVPAAYPAD